MFSGIDFLLKRTMSSFFDAIKNLLTAYHTDKSSTGKIIEPMKRIKQLIKDSLILFSLCRFSSKQILVKKLVKF